MADSHSIPYQNTYQIINTYNINIIFLYNIKGYGLNDLEENATDLNCKDIKNFNLRILKRIFFFIKNLASVRFAQVK